MISNLKLVPLGMFMLVAATCVAAAPPLKLPKCNIPTKSTYDNFKEDATVAPLGPRHWVQCKGTYAYCGFANCTILPDTPWLAACGCYEPPWPFSFVTPRQLKSKTDYWLTSVKCFKSNAMENNNTGCLLPNTAPVCNSINKNTIYGGKYELVSTFRPSPELSIVKCSGPGLFAECMTAACCRKEAFDGSPVTCYCPVVHASAGRPYGVAQRKGGENVSCKQPTGYVMSGEYDTAAADDCAKDQSCVPTAEDYNINVSNDVMEPGRPSHWVQCRGPYAYCGFANCTVMPGTNPPLAACGCYEPNKQLSFVTPRQLKSKEWFDKTQAACFNGNAYDNNNTRCLLPNSAPVCDAINANIIYDGKYQVISTFSPSFDLRSKRCSGPGLFAECMSAACYRTPAFDGSPVTCYCPIVSAPADRPFGLAQHADGPEVACDQPTGFVLSGEYIASGSSS